MMFVMRLIKLLGKRLDIGPHQAGIFMLTMVVTLTGKPKTSWTFQAAFCSRAIFSQPFLVFLSFSVQQESRQVLSVDRVTCPSQIHMFNTTELGMYSH